MIRDFKGIAFSRSEDVGVIPPVAPPKVSNPGGIVKKSLLNELVRGVFYIALNLNPLS
jgi:hypothetical protein